jgi:curved DNA-binding protein
MPLTLNEVAQGASKTVAFQHQGQSENLTVKIPKGMIHGKKLRLTGKGSPSPYGGPAGDLFIKSSVLDDPLFSAEAHDLTTYRTIKLTEALIGTTIAVPTLEGKELSLRIPPGCKHKTKMRLTGHGLPHMRSDKRGDLYVIVQVEMPKHLTDAQKELVLALAQTGL